MNKILQMPTIPSTEIEPVNAAEYPELIEIWERSVKATHHFLSEADIQYYKPLILEQYFDQVQLFCIKDKGSILGFIGIDGTFIQMLFIDPQVMGRGIGKALIRYAIEVCGANQVDVNEQNQQAVGFYTHMGFEVTQRYEQDSEGKPFPILSMRLHPQ